MVAVLTPFDGAGALPEIEKIAEADVMIAYIRLTFPDGQRAKIASAEITEDWRANQSWSGVNGS